MEVKATAKYIRVQPRKVRIVADELRGKPAVHSAALLRYHPSKSARMLRKVLMSAIANAQENSGLAPDMLRIASITVDAGPRLKRIQARAMGRAYRIEKKTSHITVTVEDYEGEPRIKPHGTKAKARRWFAGLAKAAAKKKKADDPKPEEETPLAADVTEEAAAVEEAPAAEEAPAEAQTDSTEPEPNAESDETKETEGEA